MSKRRSRSGKVKIIRRITPQPLTEAQENARQLAKRAVLSGKAADKEAYEDRLRQQHRL